VSKKKGKKKSKIREWTETLITALIIALFIRAFIIEAFRIPTSSMEPTLLGDNFYKSSPGLSKNRILRWLQLHTYLVGDHLFVCKFAYGIPIPFIDKYIFEFHPPKRFDVVVFKHPEERRTFIKRVVALPGEEIMIKDGKVFINGKLLDDRYGHYSQGPSGIYDDWKTPFVIPEDHYFVMGDNRSNSYDSRSWGPLPKNYIKGKAIFIYWPPHRIGLIR
jgi:signal peptidase I